MQVNQLNYNYMIRMQHCHVQKSCYIYCIAQAITHNITLEGRFLENSFIHTCHPFTPYGAGDSIQRLPARSVSDSLHNILLSLICINQRKL